MTPFIDEKLDEKISIFFIRNNNVGRPTPFWPTKRWDGLGTLAHLSYGRLSGVALHIQKNIYYIKIARLHLKKSIFKNIFKNKRKLNANFNK